MSSSTCTATAATATTRATNRASPSPTCTRRSASSPASPRSTASGWRRTGRSRPKRPPPSSRTTRTPCETALAEVKAAAADQTARQQATLRRVERDFPAAVFVRAGGTRAITPEVLEKIARAVTHAPESIHVLDKLRRNLLDRRLKVFEKGGPYDWSFAETLAFGSLLLDGKPVRLSGQDSRRGHVFPAPERACTTKRPASVTSRSTTSPRGRRASACTTARSPRRPCWGSTTGTRSTTRHAVFVGGAVRRFRQRRADDHRPVHRVGGKQMAAAQRHRAAAAARLRGPGAGTFQRARGAVPPIVRGGQHPGVQPDDARAVFPRPAAADDAVPSTSRWSS